MEGDPFEALRPAVLHFREHMAHPDPSKAEAPGKVGQCVIEEGGERGEGVDNVRTALHFRGCIVGRLEPEEGGRHTGNGDHNRPRVFSRLNPAHFAHGPVQRLKLPGAGHHRHPTGLFGEDAVNLRLHVPHLRTAPSLLRVARHISGIRAAAARLSCHLRGHRHIGGKVPVHRLHLARTVQALWASTGRRHPKMPDHIRRVSFLRPLLVVDIGERLAILPRRDGHPRRLHEQESGRSGARCADTDGEDVGIASGQKVGHELGAPLTVGLCAIRAGEELPERMPRHLLPPVCRLPLHLERESGER